MNNFPIHKECMSENGSISNLQLLLNMKFDINQYDNYQNTPLHYTIQYNNHQITEFLINNGADMSIVNMNYDIPLMIAIKNNNMNMIKLLLNHNATMTNEKYRGRLSPILYSILNNKFEIVKLLHQKNNSMNSYEESIIQEFKNVINWTEYEKIFKTK
jgi:ankyrin repeat protein